MWYRMRSTQWMIDDMRTNNKIATGTEYYDGMYRMLRM